MHCHPFKEFLKIYLAIWYQATRYYWQRRWCKRWHWEWWGEPGTRVIEEPEWHFIGKKNQMTFKYAKKLKRRWEHEYENHKAPVLDFTGPKNFMSNDWNFLAVGSTRRWLPYFTFNTSVALWCWPFIQCNVGIKHGLLNVNIRLWFRPSLRGICNLQIIMWMYI